MALSLVTACAATGGAPQSTGGPPQSRAVPIQPPDDACAVVGLRPSQAVGVVVRSPDESHYLRNSEDDKGIAQLYLGARGDDAPACITCDQPEGGPRADRYKLQPVWHPSGRWFVVGVERDTYTKPPILGWSRRYVEGQLRSGLWTDMWAVSADGRRWRRLTTFQSGAPGVADGYTGPAFTPDGRRAVWSQIVDGNVLVYTFGRWELMTADVEERDGLPELVNRRDITPRGMHWNEPGNFHPDGRTLLLSGSVEKDAQGMEQYLLDVTNGRLRNLTNSPQVWDEHGQFSPDGSKILFMSAHPYRDDPGASRVLSIRTEFMLMDADGGSLVQLTHFRERGHPDFDRGGIAANPIWHRDGRGADLRTLQFPDYVDWVVEFAGACGGRR